MFSFYTTKKRGHKAWWRTCPQETKNRCQSFKFLLSGVSSFEMVSLQISKWTRSKNSRMHWSAFMFRFAKRIVWKTNERCTSKNFWLRIAAPGFWTKAWWFTRGVASYQRKDKLISKKVSKRVRCHQCLFELYHWQF